jgi:hypothetical protein
VENTQLKMKIQSLKEKLESPAKNKGFLEIIKKHYQEVSGPGKTARDARCWCGRGTRLSSLWGL